MKYDVVIIGAGATGLTAMWHLLEAGNNVCLLEAASHAGGRIMTLHDAGFQTPVEAGAEFIHGKMPLTLKLLKEAGISYTEVGGQMIGVQKGEWQKEEHDEHWDEFMDKLNKLETDLTILEFLDNYFSEPAYIHLRQAVQRFAEGFDLADISKASILSVKDEWKDIEKTQYRVDGGYGRIIDYLISTCHHPNATMYFNTPVNKIEYNRGNVTIHTTDKRTFEASTAIITVSAGVLQSGTLQFEPALTDHAVAINSLGFGTVIKFLFQFKTPFWKENHDDIGFLLTDEAIPTWWTQAPNESNLLTGWLGGAGAMEKAFESEATLLQIALQSLSSIFHISTEILRDKLTHYKIISWLGQPYIKGGYCFNTLHSKNAKEILSTPMEDTIYFAGEALLEGGTVEDALKSGRNVATKLFSEHYSEKQH